MRISKLAVTGLTIFLSGLTTTVDAQNHPLEQTWELVEPMSSNVDRYTRRMQLEFRLDGDNVHIMRNWGRRRTRFDTLLVPTNGSVHPQPIKRRNAFLTTIYSAIHPKPGTPRKLSGSWDIDGRTLKMRQAYEAEVSQGSVDLEEHHTFSVSGDGQFLTYTLERQSRREQPTARYVFKIKGSLRAHMMRLEDNWEVQGDLQRQAMLISLQGLANREKANLYFVYPETWQFTYSESLYEWYRDKRGYTFTTLRTPAEALDTFREHVKGYIVWDKSVRTSLIVAYTAAGIEDAVVATEAQIPMLDSLGFRMIEDFRGIFAGMNDAQIYSWAKDKYWARSSRKFLIWLGGHAGRIMLPGIADWGVDQRAFMQDLSADPSDTVEYNMAKDLLGEMRKDALIMGWHSYAKDLESQHVTLCSSFGLPVLGLHNNPNVSFENKIGFSHGFEFKNNHNVEPDKTYTPEKKVYLACIQTDGIGLGAWLRPGRGEIPYAWETLMNYSWLVPSLLEYFYATATPNDYFIGALSGPGYMYPKSVPKNKLPGLLRRADSLMKRLDLRVFDIMDYSIHEPPNEFADLTKSVIDAYYENMPDAIGFVNGYVPANTYEVRDGRPMISFEYYLSPIVTEEEAVTDLLELGDLNAERPYFLLLHIREWSDISRVKSIIDQLPDDYELLPVDLFLKMAGSKPTFQRRFIQR